MVPFNLKELAKFGLNSNCSQKLDECSLDRARKILAAAQLVGFSLKCARFPYGKTGKRACATNVSVNNSVPALLAFY